MPAPTIEEFHKALEKMDLKAPSNWALYVAIAKLQDNMAALGKRVEELESDFLGLEKRLDALADKAVP